MIYLLAWSDIIVTVGGKEAQREGTINRIYLKNNQAQLFIRSGPAQSKQPKYLAD